MTTTKRLTRSQIELVAGVLRDVELVDPEPTSIDQDYGWLAVRLDEARCQMIHAFADALVDVDSTFDRGRFLEQCGLGVR